MRTELWKKEKRDERKKKSCFLVDLLQLPVWMRLINFYDNFNLQKRILALVRQLNLQMMQNFDVSIEKII